MSSVTFSVEAPAITEPEAQATGRLMIDNLTCLLSLYQTEQDYLSLRLHKWGKKFICLAEAALVANDARGFMRKAIERIRKLREQVLRDPLKDAPLENPLFDGNWAWSEATFFECRRLFATSPLQADHILPSSLPAHHFARAMIGWIPSDQAGSSALVLASKALVSEAHRVFAELAYSRKATAALADRLTREARWSMKQSTESTRQLAIHAKAISAEVLLQVQQTNSVHEAQITGRIEKVQENLETKLRQATNSFVATNSAHAARIGQLQEQTAEQRETIAAQGSQIGSLQQHIAAQQQQIRDLQDAAQDDGFMCIIS